MLRLGSWCPIYFSNHLFIERGADCFVSLRCGCPCSMSFPCGSNGLSAVYWLVILTCLLDRYTCMFIEWLYTVTIYSIIP